MQRNWPGPYFETQFRARDYRLRGVYRRCQWAFTSITGYGLDEVRGRNPSMFKSGCHAPEFYSNLWRTLLATGRWDGEIIDRRKNGELYPKWLSITTVRDESGNPVNFIGSFQDISERKAAEEKIQFLAHHDVLTARPTDSCCAIASVRPWSKPNAPARTRPSCSWTWTNSNASTTLSAWIGDYLLIAAVRRLKARLREADTISRQGRRVHHPPERPGYPSRRCRYRGKDSLRR